MTRNQRLKKLEETRTQLKKEFVGVDKQIDLILNSMKSWYVTPELRFRPTIINLWGITGTYKTSLIRRVVKLLALDDLFVEVDARKIKEQGFIGSALDRDAFYVDRPNGKYKYAEQPNVFLIDEFQNAKTLDNEGEDRNGTEKMADFFSLLSDGKIIKKTNSSVLYSANALKKEVKNKEQLKDKIREEKVKNKSLRMNMYKSELESPDTEEERKVDIRKNLEITDLDALGNLFRYDLENIGFFDHEEDDKAVLKSHLGEQIHWYEGDDYKELQDAKPKDIDYYINVIEKLISEIKIEKVMEFKDILIFVVGNLDGIFGQLTMHLDTDSVTPDEYYEMTKKVTINHAKNALFRRFKPEQVARLGSNHIIFPSFNSNMYMKLIEKLNENLVKEIKTATGVKVKLHPKLNNLVFQLGAIPSQGARNIISTHEAITKMAASEATTLAVISNQTKAEITLNEERDLVITVGRKRKVLPNLLIDKEVAKEVVIGDIEVRIHEAGHAIVHIATKGLYPDKITVVGGVSAAGYVKHNKRSNSNPTSTNRQYFVDRIAICMAGRVAEEIYGIENNAGASSDIEMACMYANLAVKYYGLSEAHDNRTGYASMFYSHDNLITYQQDDSDTYEADMMIREGTLLAYQIMLTYRKELDKLVKLLGKKPEYNEEQLIRLLPMRKK